MATTLDEFEAEARQYVTLADTDHETALHGLHRLENTIRGIAWNVTGRDRARDLTAQIRADIDRIAEANDLIPPPRWSFEDVVAGGPEHRINWKGYGR